MKHIKTFELNNKYTINDIINNINGNIYTNNILKTVKKILDSGVDINSYDYYRYPALHSAIIYAIENNDTSLLELLLKYGANINAINLTFGDNALLLIMDTIDNENNINIKNKALNILYYLIEHDADWNIKNFSNFDFIDILKKHNHIFNIIINKYPNKYKNYLIKKEAEKYNL